MFKSTISIEFNSIQSILQYGGGRPLSKLRKYVEHLATGRPYKSSRLPART